ncbi:radical SAM protein, partial [Candidatus Woesearchaeota archaeon]
PEGESHDEKFNPDLFEQYDIVALSVMTPQAPDAYKISKLLNSKYPRTTTVIGGSHPRYYQSSVENLEDKISFDFVVPQDGWKPMLDIATGAVRKGSKTQILTDQSVNLDSIPPPTRPKALMERYKFGLGGDPAWHTITALGCPFSCNFCESAYERVRPFSEKVIRADLETMAKAHSELGHERYGVMIFDDVGLMKPKQVEKLSRLISETGYSSWRAFTHAYLVVRHKEDLLGPFKETGGQRIGVGLETGSQMSLNIINKRNGQRQSVEEHIEAVKIANAMGIAVDSFTMIYPWEDEKDLEDTTRMLKIISENPVNGVDSKGRPLRNHVDSTIMSPYQGTPFRQMFELLTSTGNVTDKLRKRWKQFTDKEIEYFLKRLKTVEVKPDLDPGLMWYKGVGGSSAWPYNKTYLPKERYEEEQRKRIAFRPKYR